MKASEITKISALLDCRKEAIQAMADLKKTGDFEVYTVCHKVPLSLSDIDALRSAVTQSAAQVVLDLEEELKKLGVTDFDEDDEPEKDF